MYVLLKSKSLNLVSSSAILIDNNPVVAVLIANRVRSIIIKLEERNSNRKLDSK